MLNQKGQYEEAIPILRKAIELDPKHANAHNNLGWALNGKGQYDEAIPILRKTIELDPKHAYAHSNLGWRWARRDGTTRRSRSSAKPSSSTPSTPLPTATSAGR